jgi:small subunit ribosomal protein S7
MGITCPRLAPLGTLASSTEAAHSQVSGQQHNMPPRLYLFSARSAAFRTKPVVPQKRFATPSPQQRFVSDDVSKQPKGPNQEQALHVSEEQAALDKTMGKTPPDIEQGTPIQEVRRGISK